MINSVTVKFELPIRLAKNFLVVLKLVSVGSLIESPLLWADRALAVVQSQLEQIQFHFLICFATHFISLPQNLFV